MTDMSPDARELYLDLMKRCLTNFIYGKYEEKSWEPPPFLKEPIARAAPSRELRIVERAPFDPQLREEGRDWPPHAHSMIGLKRLNNLQFCIEDVLAREIPGDLIETGVWRGGATIFMRAVLKAYGVSERLVWVADSFAGLPAPNKNKYPHDAGDRLHSFKFLAVPLEEVRANFEIYGLLDDGVCFLEGWFRDTLPSAPIKQLAVMRLDGDMYESTMDALTNLYPKLSVGGYVIVDDYGCIPACRQAIADFRQAHHITERIIEIDW
ncbi:MAG TPA: TylF/MycF family methyltransferase, partial [Candidatus Binatia bacterium]|nr:TylF/MycF family methyltransferase [Candidatus Binatia bacterium]